MLIQEKRGVNFTDIEVGQIVQHITKKTVLEMDNQLFTMLTLNTHPVHYDYEYAKNKLFKKILVNSCFTISLVTGITVDYFRPRVGFYVLWHQICNYLNKINGYSLG